MDNANLKKKMSVYLTNKGQLRNVSDELLYEILTAWESWTGSGADFYRSLGSSITQMAGIIGKAKRLKREGHFGEGELKALHIEGTLKPDSSSGPCGAIEIVWKDGHLIRFAEVSVAIDFLKKAS